MREIGYFGGRRLSSLPVYLVFRSAKRFARAVTNKCSDPAEPPQKMGLGFRIKKKLINYYLGNPLLKSTALKLRLNQCDEKIMSSLVPDTISELNFKIS